MTANPTWSHAELAAILVSALGVHEGYWRLAVTFQLGTGLTGESAEIPCAVAILRTIGLERMEIPDALSVDAAIVNPRKAQRTRQ